MLENQTRPSHPTPRNAGTFTVIWQGEKFVGDDAEVSTYITEVIPGEYGFLDVDDLLEQDWLSIAVAEQFDAADHNYNNLDLLFVIDGGVILHLEGAEN